MSLVKIRAALTKPLMAIQPVLATDLENMPMARVSDDQPFQRVTLMPASPENPVPGGGMYREVGHLQVDMAYPESMQGPGHAAERAELIRQTFYQGASFTEDGITVIIHRTPHIGAAWVESNRYWLPVSVRYFANILL